MVKAKQGKNIAVLFGSERTGLTNEEMDLCQYFVNIPCNPDYTSLNLAAAVQIVCYELWQMHLSSPETAIPRQTSLATRGEIELFYEHLAKTLTHIGFLQASHPRQLMRKLRRFFDRIQIEKNELHILRGILAAIDKK
jgi:TrmH family RNA methyltransferase